MELSNVYKQVAQEQGLPVEEVKRIYRTYFMGIRSYISHLPFSDYQDIPEQMKVNINLPSIGKLYFNKNYWLKRKSKT